MSIPETPRGTPVRPAPPSVRPSRHIERHFTAGETVRDIVIGMSDGLTVPFALAAGLSGAVAASRIVVTAGLAEVAAGSIAMGLGGYLAARSDAEHYVSELAREEQEIRDVPDMEAMEQRTLVRAQRDEALEDCDGSGIVFLAEIDADEKRAHETAASKALNGHK